MIQFPWPVTVSLASFYQSVFIFCTILALKSLVTGTHCIWCCANIEQNMVLTINSLQFKYKKDSTGDTARQASMWRQYWLAS